MDGKQRNFETRLQMYRTFALISTWRAKQTQYDTKQIPEKLLFEKDIHKKVLPYKTC